MSKLVKDLMTNEVASRLQGVDDCLVANLIGLDANSTVALRKRLREKDIRIMVVKNSLARRATEDSPLAAAFEGLGGFCRCRLGCGRLHLAGEGSCRT